MISYNNYKMDNINAKLKRMLLKQLVIQKHTAILKLYFECLRKNKQIVSAAEFNRRRLFKRSFTIIKDNYIQKQKEIYTQKQLHCILS
jgi:hypothetical protein